MIRCQECNAENVMTAVFCRACSKKLDLSKIRPEMDIGVSVSDTAITERSGSMKRVIRMVAVGVALYLAMRWGKKIPKVPTMEAVNGLVALFVSVIVAVEIAVEIITTGAMERIVPWVVLLLAYTTVAQTSWPAAISLGVVVAAMLLTDAWKRRPPPTVQG